MDHTLGTMYKYTAPPHVPLVTKGLDFSSCPNTLPLVTKFANPIRASISSIVLNPEHKQPGKKSDNCAFCTPCLHLTGPCDLFERGCFDAGTDDSEEQREEGF